MFRKYSIAALMLALLFTPAAAAGGKLLVECNVEARVYLNSICVGDTDKTISDLPTGKVKLKIAAEGYEPIEKEITLSDGELSKWVAKLKKEGKGEGKSTLDRTEETKPKKEEPPKRIPQAGKPDKGKETADKKEDGKEDSEKKDEGPKFTEDDVKTAVKESDKTKLLEILKSKSEYRTRLMAAAALHRLKEEDGTDAIDDEVVDKFKDAPKDFLEKSPIMEGRNVLDIKALAIILKTKNAKFDTWEEVVAAYLALIELDKRHQSLLVDEEEARSNMRTRGRGRRGRRRALNDKETVQIFEEDKKLTIECMKKITAMLKSACRNKDRDLGALAKHLMKKAGDRISAGKK